MHHFVTLFGPSSERERQFSIAAAQFAIGAGCRSMLLWQTRTIKVSFMRCMCWSATYCARMVSA
jgi:hypothetical protein